MLTDDRKSLLRLTVIYVVILGVFSAVCRLVPYYFFDPMSPNTWNLAPVGALALFVGSRLRGYGAYVVPLVAMIVSDLLLIQPLSALGYSAFGWGRLLVYTSFLGYVLIGRLIGEGEMSPMVIGGGTLLGSLQFFLMTNFACWPGNPQFEPTLGGLLHCYYEGLPFYRNTLASDLIFAAVFFGLHAALVWSFSRQRVRQPA